ncbi:PD-(D/E)XK nuclease family protein [Actinopolymorpha sp. B11F2]|uniref:RecB family exonuclease n=1 Tax=Actinopolymorpha sp. B11F2 TaxID=3160862 RepID=UPI0032E3B2C6
MGARQQQLGFEAMPRRLFRATPTRLLGWLDCPRRYRFTYLERPTPPKGPPWAHNSVGASVHTALASWWRLPVHGRTPDAAGKILQRVWIDEGFRDSAQSDRWCDYARRMVEHYVTGLDPCDEPIGVERTVAVTTPSLALSGRIDRVDARPVSKPGDQRDTPGDQRDAADEQGDTPGDQGDPAGEPPGDPGEVELVVVDYKTGRRSLTTADARSSLALAVYAAATARTLHRRCRRVELHHLPTGTVVWWEHSAESLTRHIARADGIGAEAAEAEAAYAQGLSPAECERTFPPMPGPQCAWCDFSAHCPEGRSAYPSNRPWDGLDTAVG